mmetsp:Transcript_17644/g.35361  ORF Transcript_17644/g.35361 Transcript_17644/m.35361 type:complete len:226 (-) Transcript_17644:153-830(-)
MHPHEPSEEPRKRADCDYARRPYPPAHVYHLHEYVRRGGAHVVRVAEALEDEVGGGDARAAVRPVEVGEEEDVLHPVKVVVLPVQSVIIEAAALHRLLQQRYLLSAGVGLVAEARLELSEPLEVPNADKSHEAHEHVVDDEGEEEKEVDELDELGELLHGVGSVAHKDLLKHEKEERDYAKNHKFLLNRLEHVLPEVRRLRLLVHPNEHLFDSHSKEHHAQGDGS